MNVNFGNIIAIIINNIHFLAITIVASIILLVIITIVIHTSINITVAMSSSSS